MKSLLLSLLFIFAGNSFASFVLESGDYAVKLQDRSGGIHYCKLNIQNNLEQATLLLNITNCPPNVIDVTLFSYEDGALYQSDKIVATTERGGYIMYEIRPKSNVQFEMTSYRVYGDGGVNKPRKVIATKPEVK